MTKTLEITAPIDWHVHFRDGEVLKTVAPETARAMSAALIMPNLVPPVVNADLAQAYKARILSALSDNSAFTPYMTLYLTQDTTTQDILEAHARGDVLAAKLYPAGATTNSSAGVKRIWDMLPVFEAMAKIGMPLCVHGEVNDPDVDIFDREARFVETILAPVQSELPELRVTLEHITTKESADYVWGSKGNCAASITPQHIVYNRNILLSGGIRPHFYCLPVLKREEHRRAIRKAATSGDPRFFMGTDTAPHLAAHKISECGCAGIFSAPNALSVYAQVFEEEGALDAFEGFVAHHGAAHYGVPRAGRKLLMKRENDPLIFPEELMTREGAIKIFDPGMPLFWQPYPAE